MKRILLGGRYSSGMTAAAPPVDLRPVLLAVFVGRAGAGSFAGAEALGRFSFLLASCASRACFRSTHFQTVNNCSAIINFDNPLPFSANLFRLCASYSPSEPCSFTAASLHVFAYSNTIGFSKRSKP